MATKGQVGDIPDVWPPEWLKQFKETTKPTEVSYAASYALIYYSTEARLHQAQAVLMLFGKDHTRSNATSVGGDGSGRYCLFIPF